MTSEICEHQQREIRFPVTAKKDGTATLDGKKELDPTGNRHGRQKNIGNFGNATTVVPSKRKDSFREKKG